MAIVSYLDFSEVSPLYIYIYLVIGPQTVLTTWLSHCSYTEMQFISLENKFN